MSILVRMIPEANQGAPYSTDSSCWTRAATSGRGQKRKWKRQVRQLRGVRPWCSRKEEWCLLEKAAYVRPLLEELTAGSRD